MNVNDPPPLLLLSSVGWKFGRREGLGDDGCSVGSVVGAGVAPVGLGVGAGVGGGDGIRDGCGDA